VSDLPGMRGLRFAKTDRLVVPPFHLYTVGSRTFNVAAAPRSARGCDIVTNIARF